MKTKVQKVTELQSEKDETDTHIAILTALDYKPNEVIVTGITGGRLDHYEAALHDICRLQLKNPSIIFSIQNKQNIIQFLPAGTHQINYGDHYKSSGDYIKEVCMINSIGSNDLKAGNYIILPYYSLEVK